MRDKAQAEDCITKVVRYSPIKVPDVVCAEGKTYTRVNYVEDNAYTIAYEHPEAGTPELLIAFGTCRAIAEYRMHQLLKGRQDVKTPCAEGAGDEVRTDSDRPVTGDTLTEGIQERTGGDSQSQGTGNECIAGAEVPVCQGNGVDSVLG